MNFDRAILAALIADCVVIAACFISSTFDISLKLATYDATDINAAAAVASALFALTTAWIAWVQLGTLGRQQRQNATLQSCDRYDTDEGLRSDRLALRQFLSEPQKFPLTALQVELAWTSVFNYFDAISIGLKQGLYDYAIAYDHIENILRRWIVRLREAKDAESAKFRENFRRHYPRTISLCSEWKIQTDMLDEPKF